MTRIEAAGKSGAVIKDTVESLAHWYRSEKRPLPWRMNRDPYRIWVSEVMLQQTTVAAVIPYYDRFMNRFPKLSNLATAPLEAVLEMWAGLGYYSRARNLHKAAQELATRTEFPRDHRSLLELPGFGDYTARAVASLAHGERVGVLDGNVIRVLCRYRGLRSEWWTPAERKKLQAEVDSWAAVESADSSETNQALMELGATICTPQSPTCMLCPIRKSCVAFQQNLTNKLPLPKPRRPSEVWIWQPVVRRSSKGVLLVKNDYAPFLKGHLILPGTVRRLAAKGPKPKSFDLRGGVTHHDIYVKVDVKTKPTEKLDHSEKQWVPLQDLKSHVPSSLVRKTIVKAISKSQESKGRNSKARNSKSLVIALLAPLLFNSACQSKPTATPANTQKPQSAGTPSAIAPANRGTQFVPVDGKAFTMTGKQVQVSRLAISGSIRSPVPFGANHLAYASLKPGSSRWQAYSWDLTRNSEQRLSFDAGDAEPIASLRGKLIIASTTEAVKQSKKILGEYSTRFGEATDIPSSMAHLYLQREKVSRDPAQTWRIKFDSNQRFGIAIAETPPSRIYYRLSVSTSGDHRTWSRLSPPAVPDGASSAVIDAAPLGNQIVWSTGSTLAISDAAGRNARAIALQSNAPIANLTEISADPKNEWVIGAATLSSGVNSGAGSEEGTARFNLVAVHLPSGCVKPLTQLSGDERSPTLSPDSTLLYYSHRDGDLSSVERIPYELPATSASCP